MKADHHMYYCAVCDLLIRAERADKHLASRPHLRRATSSPSQSNASMPTSVEIQNTLSISSVPSSPSPLLSQPSPTSSQPVTFVSFPLKSTHTSACESGVDDRNVVESDHAGDPSLVLADAFSASSTTSVEDEITLRERMESLRQQPEVIAGHMWELEKQEEEIKLEEEIIRTRLSASENRIPTPSVSSEFIASDASSQTPPAVFSSSLPPEDQPHVFDAHINGEWSYCPPCNQVFDDVAAFRTHCVDNKDHAYCLFCERWFSSMSVLQQHFIFVRDARDPTHNYEPDSSRVINQTVKAEPAPVRREEVPQVAVVSSRPEPVTRCVICSKKFGNKAALASHEKGKETCRKALTARASRDTPNQVPPTPTIPRVTPVSIPNSASQAGETHNCLVCSRKFGSQIALIHHERASKTHKEKKQKLDPVSKPEDTRCPLCSRDFRFPSGVADHIESGACTNAKVTRHHVKAAVHAMDISPSITTTKRIAGSAVPTVTTYVATELAFNGKAYECYLCHHEFRTLKSLNTHLTSPTHDAKEFICPHEKCKKTFKVLSALIRHIESECCGLAQLYSVRKFAHALTGQFSHMLTL
ncbi:hypothetical protein VKT23_009926 [Stygiomarasmius scandens]|uniref:C2H2-type domain-containing protein n=1 Tax=Marasmiellus scandens TaxID=2682957 RepID=A0ABR1JCJ4_9AGAR